VILSHGIIVFDAATVIIMIITAYLSRRLGDALNIKPYYKVLYVTAVVIAFLSIGDIVFTDSKVVLPVIVSVTIRLCAAGVALLVSLRYWSWLFSEFLRK